MRPSLLALMIALAAPTLPQAQVGREPTIVVEDVERFYRVYDSAAGHPTAEQLQRDYVDQGTAGLHVFARLRHIDGERIAGALAQNPKLYVDARRCAAALPAIRARLGAALAKFGRLYPEAVFPPVTIAIGRGKPVGTADETGVMIGLEALCAADFLDPDPEGRFVHVIAHEFVHVQQSHGSAKEEGGTVLEASLLEGGAEFIGELTSGGVSYGHLASATRGREAEFERAFVADQDKPADGSAWLYNGRGTADRPGDLGYWVGYRIAKAYYCNAPDKRAALRDLVMLGDAKAILAGSGWRPGVDLSRCAPS